MAGGAAYVICFLVFSGLSCTGQAAQLCSEPRGACSRSPLPLLKAKDNDHGCLDVLSTKKVTEDTKLFSGGLCRSVMQGDLLRYFPGLGGRVKLPGCLTYWVS